jgi:hypothetical protein
VKYYLTKTHVLLEKLERPNEDFSVGDVVDVLLHLELDRYMGFLNCLLTCLIAGCCKGNRFLMKKRCSPTSKYTERITKGKLSPNVEVGKKLTIITDQYNLIFDYRIMESQPDSEMVKPTVESLATKNSIRCLGFDKGFWLKDNKALLEKPVEKVVMPKKGKCWEIFILNY